MAIDLKPLRWDWPAVTVGDTFPAIQITETSSTTSLSRVRIKIKDADGTLKITLDSDTSGITITTSTAGAWNFTISAISASTTGALTAGFHHYDIETTDSDSTVRTEFSGTWELLAETTN